MGLNSYLIQAAQAVAVLLFLSQAGADASSSHSSFLQPSQRRRQQQGSRQARGDDGSSNSPFSGQASGNGSSKSLGKLAGSRQQQH